MKLPSLKTVTKSALYTLKRFPLALLFAFAGTALAIYIVELSKEESSLMQLLFTCFIGLPCMLGCHLYAESLSSKFHKTIVLIAGLIFIALYGAFFAPQPSFSSQKEFLIFFVLNICMHLWVAVAAYITKKERYGFWRFNDILFIRIIVSALFSGVLFGGLSLAIVSVDELFSIDINEELYLKLFFLVGGIFNTWFFLSGIPSDYNDLCKEQPFPKGLKIFSQYILIPLSIVYLAILYAYGIKIVVEWSLPRGWVSALILLYSAVGILAILLVYPLREQAQNAWVKLFTRFFFIAIIPLITLLVVSIYARVSDYGITEPRYYLILLAIWLTIISFYYIFSKQKNIKLIPVSLLVFGLLSLFGPWNTFNVSKNSQYKRLEKIFTQYDMVSDNGLNTPNTEVSKEDVKQMKDIIHYLAYHDHYESLSNLYQTDVTAIASTFNDKHDSWRAKSQLIDTLYAIANIEDELYRNYENYYIKAKDESFDIQGYGEACYIDYWYPNSKKNTIATLKDGTSLNLKYIDNIMVVLKDEEEVSRIPINELSKKLAEMGDKEMIAVQQMSVSGTGKIKTKLILHNLNIIDNEGSISNITGFLLIE